MKIRMPNPPRAFGQALGIPKFYGKRECEVSAWVPMES
jgi:hypothetical protein